MLLLGASWTFLVSVRGHPVLVSCPPRLQHLVSHLTRFLTELARLRAGQVWELDTDGWSCFLRVVGSADASNGLFGRTPCCDKVRGPSVSVSILGQHCLDDLDNVSVLNGCFTACKRAWSTRALYHTEIIFLPILQLLCVANPCPKTISLQILILARQDTRVNASGPVMTVWSNDDIPATAAKGNFVLPSQHIKNSRYGIALPAPVSPPRPGALSTPPIPQSQQKQTRAQMPCV